MAKLLYPRCPFSHQEIDEIFKKLQVFQEELLKSQKWNFESDDDRTLFFKETMDGNPEYKIYRLWESVTESIMMLAHGDVVESEYLENSKEWKEYSVLETQMIYEQKLPYDSPEWQAVIEKYRRKDEKTECETNTDAGKIESEAIRELSEEKSEDENPNDTPPTHGISKQEVQEALDEFHRHTIVNPNKTLFLSHLPDGSLEVKDGDKVVARVERIESGEFNVEYFESEE